MNQYRTMENGRSAPSPSRPWNSRTTVSVKVMVHAKKSHIQRANSEFFPKCFRACHPRSRDLTRAAFFFPTLAAKPLRVALLGLVPRLRTPSGKNFQIVMMLGKHLRMRSRANDLRYFRPHWSTTWYCWTMDATLIHSSFFF
jgi:hypothetical protein